MTDAREALVALLRQADHAPLSTHDPRDGSCQLCPWPLHEMPPEDIADAILLAGWTPPTVKPPVEDVARRHSRVSMDGTCICGAVGIGFILGYGEHLVAETLALLPGRTEAEVKAEALREAAQWLAATNYPTDWHTDARVPDALWEAFVDVVHEDDDGRELTREEVESWLAEEAGRIAREEADDDR